MEWHEYIASVKDQIRNKKAKVLIEDELYDHFDEQEKAYEQEGMDHDTATAKAIDSMGDAVLVGSQFDRVHRPKTDFKFLGIIIAISIFTVILQFFVDKNVQMGSTPGYYFRQEVLYVLGGIAIMAAIYFADYTLIGKYPIILWTAFCIFSLLTVRFGHKTFSFNESIFLLSYLFLPLYAGVLFRLRTYQLKGLVASGVLAVVPILICFIGRSMPGAIHFSLIALIMVCTAVAKGWFGKSKKLNFAVIFAGTGILTTLIVLFFQHYWMTAYEQARLNAVLTKDRSTYELFYQQNTVTDSLKHLKLFGDSASTASTQIPAVESKYILVFIFQTFGILVGIIILVAFIYLLIRAFRIVKKQKSYLGFMVSLSCALILTEQIIGYIYCNFTNTRLTVLINQQYFPFLSRGGRNILCSFIITGLLLSIYRNTDLVSNHTRMNKKKPVSQ